MYQKAITTTEINYTSEKEKTLIEKEDTDNSSEFNDYLDQNKNVKSQSYSLFNHPDISAKFRYGVPILLLMNMAVFIDSNMNPGAEVCAYVDLAGFESQQYMLKKFTLIDTVKDMWNADVQGLALLIGVFSGAWPYIKIFTLLVCWFLKEGQLKYRNREILLVILDAAGKWALVDSYVLVLMIVGFRLQIQEQIVVSEAFNIIVNPKWGFYSFILGAIVLLIITHIIVYQHRGLREIKVSQQKKANSLRSDKQWAFYGTLGAIFSSVVLLVAGGIVKAFQFTFQGLVTLVLPEDQIVTAYSLFKLGYVFPDNMYEPNSFGSRYIQVLFIMLSIVLPIVFMILLGVLETVKMKIQHQQKLFNLTEIIYAWSSLDVMIVSIMVALVEISQFAQYIIGDGCDGINQVIEMLNDNPNIPVKIEPAVCFGVKTTLDNGCSILFTSAIVFFGLGSISLRKLKNRLDKKAYSIMSRESFLVTLDEKQLQKQQYYQKYKPVEKEEKSSNKDNNNSDYSNDNKV